MRTAAIFSTLLVLSVGCSAPQPEGQSASAPLVQPFQLAQPKGFVDRLDPQLPQTPPVSALFEGARLITGDGTAPIDNSAFIVENGRVTQVGKRGELQPPAGGTRVDLAGKTVMPGIVDGHNHIGYDNKLQARDWRIEEGWGAHNFDYANVMDDMRRFAYYGVVATWDAGYGLGEDQYRVMYDTLAGKDQNAARYIGSGTGITWPSAAQGPNMRQSTYRVRTADEGRRAVEDLAYYFEPIREVYPVPILKYWVDETPREVFAGVIDEAHKRNMKVVTGGGDDELGWIQSGGDGWAHGPGTEDEVLAALKEVNKDMANPRMVMLGFTLINQSRRWRAPYLFPPNQLIAETMHPLLIKRQQDWFTNATDEFKAKVRKQNEGQWANVKKTAACECIPIGFGSDGSGRMGPDKWPGWSAMVELENYVLAGMTPMQVIVAATKTSAHNLALDDLGTIAPGKSADFIILDANPLDDITNTRRINKVYMRGREVNRAGLRASWARFWEKPVPLTYQ